MKCWKFNVLYFLLRYTDQDLEETLNIASFVDPRFKTLAHLSPVEQQGVVHSVIGEAQFLALAVQPEQAQTCSEGPSDPPTKRQKSAMEMMFADTFSNGSTDEANSSVSPLRIVKKEVSMYQEEDLVALDSNPLILWKLNECKYLYI